MKENRNRTARHSRSSKFPSMKGAITDRQTLSLRVSWRLRSRHPPPSTAFFAAFFSPLTSLFSAPLSAVAQPFFFVFFAANVCVSTRECALTAFVSHFYVRHDFFFFAFFHGCFVLLASFFLCSFQRTLRSAIHSFAAPFVVYQLFHAFFCPLFCDSRFEFFFLAFLI